MSISWKEVPKVGEFRIRLGKAVLDSYDDVSVARAMAVRLSHEFPGVTVAVDIRMHSGEVQWRQIEEHASELVTHPSGRRSLWDWVRP